MKINFRTYEKRDGDLMLYINRSNKVSVGITEAGFSPYSRRTTQGQRNAFNAAIDVVAEHGKPFTGDLSKHDENQPRREKMTNRFDELNSLERSLVDYLINTIAAEALDDLILHQIIRDAQTKIREGAKS